MDVVNEFNQHRPALFGLAYRMLGSSMDAEDVLQEAFLNWQAVPTESIQSPKAYLVRIVTHLCIDHLRLARVQREQYIGMWLPEPLAESVEGDPDRESELAESLSTAFLLLLERLSPVDRAVLLLHDVFSYNYEEIGAIIGRSSDNARQIGHRARQRITEERPRYTASSAETEQVAQQFVAAFAEGDLPKVFALLSTDVILRGDGGGKINARRTPIVGAAQIIRFFERFPPSKQWVRTLKLVWVNGQPTMIEYHDGQVFSVTTFTIAAGKIQAIYCVLNPDKLHGFDPAT